MLVCSISNKDVKEYGALMLFPSKKVAKASFLNWLESQENKHFDPCDFDLVYLADFDIKSAKLKVVSAEVLASGKEEDKKE